MITRKHFVAMIAAAAATRPLKAFAQSQVVHNGSQIVSTDDVWVQQDAAGNQNVYDGQGRLVAQAVGNDLQVVSTGTVTVGQRAAGSQTVVGAQAPITGACVAGTFSIVGCSIELCTSDCAWVVYRCPGCREKRCTTC